MTELRMEMKEWRIRVELSFRKKTTNNRSRREVRVRGRCERKKRE